MIVPPLGGAVTIPCSDRQLDGWLVEADSPRAALLVLHGIGDKLPYWRGVQAMLHHHGITSLVFDYAGYGNSAGWSTPENLELDSIAAYRSLHERALPQTPIFLLGYSLGTGLLAEVAPRLEPAPCGLIFCQAYPSFREAARCVLRFLPALAKLVPDIWQTRTRLRVGKLPVLVVHGEQDALFPSALAKAIHAAAAQADRGAQLAIVPGYTHNAGYLLVPPDYWAPVLKFMADHGGAADDCG